MMKSVLATSGLLAVASAFTQPTAQTYGALLTPDTVTPVVAGESFEVKWEPKQPADGVTVALVLCNGPGENCVLEGSAVVEGVSAAAGKYTWDVPCSLPEGEAKTASGKGMLIIVDGTGEFQYSQQFSVKKSPKCSAVSSSTTAGPSSSSPYSTTPTSTASDWTLWTTSSTTSAAPTTFNTTTKPAYTTNPANVSSSKEHHSYTTSRAAVETTAESKSEYVRPTATQDVSSTSAATPATFTGAAAACGVNFAMVLGVVGFGVLAL